MWIDDASMSTKWSPLAPPSTSQLVGWSKKKAPKKKKNQQQEQQEQQQQPRKEPKKESINRASPNSKKRNHPDASVDLTVPVVDVPLLTPPHDESVTTGATIAWTGTEARLTWHDLKEQRMMCLIGRASVRLVKGRVQLLGHELSSTESRKVESPSWASALTMIALEEHSEVSIVSTSVTGTKSFDLCPPSAQEVRPTILPPTWTIAIDHVLRDWFGKVEANAIGDAKLLICGAKGVGKSTCVRYAINRALARTDSVMVLDCDAGQPEFSPPGLLTLTNVREPVLSPPHLHMAETHAGAKFFGYTTSKADPTLYLEAISTLLQQYDDMVTTRHGGNGSLLPLIINTDGWVKGLGLEILTTLLSTLQPGHVIQILGEQRSKQFDIRAPQIQQQQCIIHKVRAYNVDSPEDLGTTLSIPSHSYRALRLCTYFLRDAICWDRIEFGQGGIIDEENHIAHHLAAAKPIVVSMDALHLLWKGECGLVDQNEGTMWNGAVVGLCKGITGPCLGLGIIRSVDYQKRLFYFLTPVPLNDLATVDTIIGGGGIQLGRECYFRGVHSESFPYITCNGISAGIGGDVMKSRNNLTRKANQGNTTMC